MRPDEIKEKIDELNLSEKLLLIEDVWDSTAHSNEELPMQEWQKKNSINDTKNIRQENRTFMIGNPFTKTSGTNTKVLILAALKIFD